MSNAPESPAETPAVASENACSSVLTDPDLALIIDAWASLPEAIRAGILAMVRATKG